MTTPHDPPPITWRRADITTLDVDAVVNAANGRMAGGTGVNGAIRRAAGPELAAACERIGGCLTGSAVITPGFDLPARWVIHAVGPIWSGWGKEDEALLASAYRASLDRASEVGATSVAFPALSCGVFGYPAPEAMRVAVQAVGGWLSDAPAEDRPTVTFAVVDDEVAGALENILGAPSGGSG